MLVREAVNPVLRAPLILIAVSLPAIPQQQTDRETEYLRKLFLQALPNR